MRPKAFTNSTYVAAFRELAKRIADSFANVPREHLPIRMFVAGGAALHFYTGSRVSLDVDAVFSKRVALPEDLDIAYREKDGTARLLYFDKQYSDVLGLLHEEAYDDSISLSLPGVNSRILDIRLLTPIDLAVSKLGRFAEQDRDDILQLAKRGLVNSKTLRARAESALRGYVGDLQRTQGSIDFACRMLDKLPSKAKRRRNLVGAKIAKKKPVKTKRAVRKQKTK